MDTLSGLLNSGIVAVNWKARARPSYRSGKNTIIVSGIARGGTSMLAQLLAAAGLFMGDERGGIVFEDVDIGDALRCRNRAALRSIIVSRNREYPSWGFKYPHIHEFLDPADLSIFRNPKLILVFRDPVAVAQRNILSMRSDLSTELGFAVAALGGLTSLALKSEIPTLLISYEKFLMRRDESIAKVLEFCGIDSASLSLSALQEAIAPENPDYLRNTRLHLHGAVECIETGKLHGWACLPGSKDALSLDLMIDHRLAGTFLADQFRVDLVGHPGGFSNRGFALDLSPYKVKASTILSVRMSGRDLYLEGSGRTAQILSRGAISDRPLALWSRTVGSAIVKHLPLPKTPWSKSWVGLQKP